MERTGFTQTQDDSRTDLIGFFHCLHGVDSGKVQADDALMKYVLLIPLLLLLACVMKPPVQEMSDARSAIKMAQALPGQQNKADSYLKSAEQALQEAAKAIQLERYERARSKALEAKRHAQQAARLKQSQHK